MIKPKHIFGGLAILLACILLYQNSTAFRMLFKGLIYSNKTYLEKTVLAIKEVNNISEWITAEYYGEVMFSWKEYQELAKIDPDTSFVRFDAINSLEQLYTWKDTARKSYFREHLKLSHKKVKFKDYAQKDSLVQTDLFKDLKIILNTNDKRTYNFVRDHALYSPMFNKAISRPLRKKERKFLGNPKKDLVLLGRGWIKAGFGLDSLSDDQFKAEEKNDTLVISGMPHPHIISSHINPWFIPKKLKGYEIVFSKKKFKPEEVKQVKVGCLRKLEQNALETGLMEEAWKSAEASVLGMLQLLGEEKIKVVRFIR